MKGHSKTNGQAAWAGEPSRRELLAEFSHLTRCEIKVLGLVLDNLSNKEIASQLQVSERAIKYHVSNLLAKFRIEDRRKLIFLYYRVEPHGSLLPQVLVKEQSPPTYHLAEVRALIGEPAAATRERVL